MTDDPLVHLGRLLTGSEAAVLASRIADGDTLTQALQGVPTGRRGEVKSALINAGVTAHQRELAVAVLRALEGAGSRTTQISPVWTLPGHAADYGSLTTSIKELVLAAKHSVTCSTFNFQKTSALWDALAEVAARDTVDVRVYLDAEAADGHVGPGSPSSAEVAAQLTGAMVFRTRNLNGKPVRNHAKFVAVDHQFIIITSANFSFSAEQRNIELGIRIDSRTLTETVERQLDDVQTSMYEPVSSQD